MRLLEIPSRALIFGLAMIVATALLLAASGCEKTPGTPEFNNAFDEENDSDNPLNLTAIVAGGTIAVTWNQPQGQNITEYDIFSGTSFPPTNLDTTVIHSAAPINTSIHPDPEPTAIYYFRIVAKAGDAFSVLREGQTQARVSTPPLVIVGDGDNSLASRKPLVMVTVNQGENLILADNPEFTNAQIDSIVTDGSPRSIEWDFGPAEDNTVKIWLHFQAYSSSYSSPVDSIRFDVNFAPALTIEGGPSVASRIVDLNIPSAGVDSMRFSDSEIGLASATWLPPAETYPDYELVDIIESQEIYGEFAGDFGFNHTATVTATPDMLTTASFYLAIPEDHVTDDSQVLGICNANATLMRFSESLDFASIPWAAYQDTFVIQLSPEPGRKVVYAQFRNDWADSPILTDYVDYISQVGQVTILAPLEGAILEGGTEFNILGISSAGSGTEEVLGVVIDLGAGEGFIPVTGTNSWSHLWSIPESVLDREVFIRASANTASGIATTFVRVTVTGSGEDP